MSPELVAAYRAARYRVDAGFELRVDRFCAPLAALHRACGVACSAFITACNPGSVRCDAAENAEREASFEAGIRALGFAFLGGRGSDPQGLWPDEESLLILGLELDLARRLASEQGQNALIWNGADAVPRLILLR
ncbi:DUF3293 domain-containing protein [Niveibacterium terrae]|uniref:DUF3293 domain-containing protein n=1 Tax=Niveibacterium terrae TaxID=3373598 RepID=UPI003A8EC022